MLKVTVFMIKYLNLCKTGLCSIEWKQIYNILPLLPSFNLFFQFITLFIWQYLRDQVQYMSQQ